MWRHPPTPTLNQRNQMSDTQNLNNAADGGLPRTPCCALTTVKLLAMSAHAGKFRRDGITPYITHPEAVAKRLRGDDEAEMVAWLHDVIEDTDLRESEMLWRGVPRDVIEAVVILTKGSRVNYDDYLARVKAHPVARKVKIADMLANLADTPTEAQIVKYARGLLFLHNV